MPIALVEETKAFQSIRVPLCVRCSHGRHDLSLCHVGALLDAAMVWDAVTHLKDVTISCTRPAEHVAHYTARVVIVQANHSS